MRSLSYDTVVFDLDGTLLNTLDDLTDSVNELLAGEGLPSRTMREVRSFLGHGARELVRSSLPGPVSEEALDRYLAIYKGVYQKNMSNKTRPYDGVMDVLSALRSAGVKMAIVSNKPDWACAELCQKTFGGLIDTAIGDRPDVAKKPAPDAVFLVLESLGSDGKHCLYVGDSEVDVRTAKNAGLTSVGVCWGFRDRDVFEVEGADYIIEKPEELLAVAGINGV